MVILPVLSITFSVGISLTYFHRNTGSPCQAPLNKPLKQNNMTSNFKGLYGIFYEISMEVVEEKNFNKNCLPYSIRVFFYFQSRLKKGLKKVAQIKLNPRPILLAGSAAFARNTLPKPQADHSVCSWFNICFYYMASSASGQDEPNRAMRLATRAGKMEPSCPLGTTRCIPHEKFPREP